MPLSSFDTPSSGYASFDAVDLLCINGNAESGATAFGLSCHATGAVANSGTELVATPFTSLANVQAALTAFLDEAGSTWVPIGTVANFADVTTDQRWDYPVAVNLANAQILGDEGSGIYFSTNGEDLAGYSLGYAPFSDFAVASAYLQPLIGGAYTFASS
jgi:hypothetical protein